MAMKAQIVEDMKTAMKAGEKDRLGVIRLILADIKRREVDERIEADDAVVLAILEKAVKQRKDSITQYEAAAREDLASIERYELGVIQAYLPAPMSQAEVEAAVLASIAESGAAGPQDMGKVMAILKPKVAGRADMGALSGMVKAKLAG